MSTKLKLLGVDVASFGDAFAAHPGRTSSASSTPRAPSTRSWSCRPTASTCWAACSSATPRHTGSSCSSPRTRSCCPPRPETLILPTASGDKPAGAGVGALPDAAQICSCNNVSKGAICTAVREQKLTAIGDVKTCTRAGNDLRILRAAGDRAAQDRAEAGRHRRVEPPVRALPAQPAGALSSDPVPQAQDVRRRAGRARQGTRLRDLQAGGRINPGVGVERARHRAEAPAAAGHQRSVHGEHPARRHVLDRPARRRRRDHARPADRDRAHRR